MLKNRKKPIMSVSGTSISKHMMSRIVLFSTIIATLISIANIFYDYTNEISDLIEIPNRISTTSSDSISRTLWNFNVSQLESQLKGLVQMKSVNALRVRDDQDRLVAEMYSPDKVDTFIEHHFIPLFFENQKMGALEVELTKTHIYQSLLTKNIIFLLLQFGKTLFVAFFIYYLFEKILIVHLKNLHKFLGELDFDHSMKFGRLKFERKRKYTDEIKVLEDKVNEMLTKLETYKLNAEEEKENSANKARLASLGEMSGGIAHEINNPISIILLACENFHELAEANELSQQESTEIIEQIEKMAHRTVKIVDGLRIFSRDGDDDEFQNCKVQKLIDDMKDFCRYRAQKLGIELQIDDLASDLAISCRQVQIVQILVNLMNNSFYAIQGLDEKWVRLEAESTDEKVTIRVTDSGNGLPPEIQSEVLKPFFTTKPVGVGTGLGLSISSRIMVEHGGALRLNTSCPNTQFVLDFPRVKTAYEPIAQAS